MKSKKHSETSMKWRAEYVKNYPPPTEGKKRCSKCKKMKHFNTLDREISQFHIRKNQAYKMRDAGYEHAIYDRPDSWCKECKNQDNNERRKRRWAENPERESKLKKARTKAYRERVGEERYLEMKRIRSRGERRRRGIGLNRDVDSRSNKSGTEVSTRPFIDWIYQTWPEGGAYQSISERVPNPHKITRIMNGTQDKVDIEWVDQVLVAFNGPHLSILYPELYSN